jgi:hypothetical protein
VQQFVVWMSNEHQSHRERVFHGRRCRTLWIVWKRRRPWRACLVPSHFPGPGNSPPRLPVVKSVRTCFDQNAALAAAA